MMTTYGIRDGYRVRETPVYFVDNTSDGKYWQPDVLAIASHLARVNGLKGIVDIGCGVGDKLIPYSNEFDIVGVDYGQNLEMARNHSFGRWMECDLNTSFPDIESSVLKRSIIVASDVIEHLTRPDNLVLTLAMFLECGALCVLSTPDRNRVYGFDQSGYPGNPHHILEWTLDELTAWLQSYGLVMEWRGWTISNNVDRQKNTILLVVSTGKREYTLGEFDSIFEVERA